MNHRPIFLSRAARLERRARAAAGFLLTYGTVAAAIGAALMLLVGCSPRGLPLDSVQRHCVLAAQVDTGDRQYCGKACSRTVYRYSYACPAVVEFTGA